MPLLVPLLLDNLKRNRLRPHRANMFSFIHVNRRVLDRSQLEARGWLSCGVDEEEDCWSEESGRFGSVGREWSAVSLALACYRRFIATGIFQSRRLGGSEG
jgi:hypothetical protein